MKRILALLTLSLAQLASSSTAHAQASAHIAFSDFQFKLTDLAVADGIAPSFTYINSYPEYNSVTAYLTGSPTAFGDGTVIGEHGVEPWSAIDIAFDSNQLPTPYPSHMTGAVRNSGTSLTTLDISATSSALGTNGATGSASFTTNIYSMLLSPHTALTLTFNLTLQSLIGPLADPLMPGQGVSTANIDVEGGTGSGYVDQLTRYYHAAGQQVTNPGTEGTQLVTISLANMSDDVAGVRLGLSGNAFVSAGTINAIPEPSTYAMLAAGLGLIGALRVRRRKSNVPGA